MRKPKTTMKDFVSVVEFAIKYMIGSRTRDTLVSQVTTYDICWGFGINTKASILRRSCLHNMCCSSTRSINDKEAGTIPHTR